jgi:hypothetical protein
MTAANGFASTALGDRNIAGGDGSFAVGRLSVASGLYAIVMGNMLTASGDKSIAIGSTLEVTGNNSIGIGLGKSGGTLSQPNTMAIVGGNVVIGSTESSTRANLTVRGTAEIERLILTDTLYNSVNTLETMMQSYTSPVNYNNVGLSFTNGFSSVGMLEEAVSTHAYGYAGSFNHGGDSALFGYYNFTEGSGAAKFVSGGNGNRVFIANSIYALKIEGSVANQTKAVATSRSLDDSDYCVVLTANSVTVTLPNLSSFDDGRTYIVKAGPGKTGCSISPYSVSQTIDGATSLSVAAGKAYTLTALGSVWYIIGVY